MRLTLIIFFLITAKLYAQKEITIEDFTDKNVFVEKSVHEIMWMKDEKTYTSLIENKIVRHSISTGEASEVILEGGALKPALNIEGYSFNTDESKILIKTKSEKIYRRSYRSLYFVYDIAAKNLKPLSENGAQSYATFSPDGSKIAFARNNNLFYVDLSTMKEVQFTEDGKINHIINGTTDWVYEEELSFVQAFFWSPDSRRIAYYRFDESGVKEYTLQKWKEGQLYPENYTYKYPKAGESNSLVTVWIHEIETGKKIKADTGQEADIYIPKIQWTRNATVLSIQKMNRLQNEMEILHANAITGKTQAILAEKSDTYIDFEYTNETYYLNDGRHFLYASEKSGYKHLYLYTLKGEFVSQVTTGDWEVLDMIGVDEKTKTVYYLSTEAGYLDSNLFSVSLDGKMKLRLTREEGIHVVQFSNNFQYYVDFCESASHPSVITLYATRKNAAVRTLENNETLQNTLSGFTISPKEFFKCAAGDGNTLIDGYMIKPANFDSEKKYPVLVYQYGGPRSPKMLNDFAGLYFYWFQLLAQKGYIIVAIDTRGTSPRGEKFVKQTYKQLGKLELEDLLAVGDFIKKLKYVDPARVGIFGWSYGGYTTALVMTKGAGMYKMGIAGAPVTNWRFYDNIYTERYLQRPQDNPQGYDENSPLTHAQKLKGNFLLIHGTGDDNVHFQNSVVFEDALIKAGKQFRSFYYPDEAHGVPSGKRSSHLFALMTDFVLEKL